LELISNRRGYSEWSPRESAIGRLLCQSSARRAGSINRTEAASPKLGQKIKPITDFQRYSFPPRNRCRHGFATCRVREAKRSLRNRRAPSSRGQTCRPNKPRPHVVNWMRTAHLCRCSARSLRQARPGASASSTLHDGRLPLAIRGTRNRSERRYSCRDRRLDRQRLCRHIASRRNRARSARSCGSRFVAIARQHIDVLRAMTMAGRRRNDSRRPGARPRRREEAIRGLRLGEPRSRSGQQTICGRLRRRGQRRPGRSRIVFS